jgi:hypothetical protein
VIHVLNSQGSKLMYSIRLRTEPSLRFGGLEQVNACVEMRDT